MATLSKNEIGLLKELLEKKMEEYRTIYNKLVETGGMELPEDILAQVAGGWWHIVPTPFPPDTTGTDTSGGNKDDR